MTEIEQLRSRIREANEAYWTRSAPVMTDTDYDKLVRKLAKLSPDDPLLTEIGEVKTEGEKVKHEQRMYSLDKVYSMEAFMNWASKVARTANEVFACSCKFDGISIEVVNGRLITRGNGIYGDDITHLAPWIDARMSSIPASYVMPMTKFLKENEGVRLVGELMISLSRFQELRSTRPEFADYKTCRNLASGFANLKPNSDLLKSLVNADGTPVPIATWVYHQGHEIPFTFRELASGKVDLVELLRDDGGFPSDGIVIRLQDNDYADGLGYTSHHPAGSMAIKFTDDHDYVQLDHVDWQVGERRVTPVAIFAPTEIGGATIQKATLHSVKFVEENRVTPGCELLVERRGAVIPKVIRVTPDESKPMIPIPDKCPVCGTELYRNGAYLECTNDQCTSGLVNRICRGLEVLGCKGIGPVMCQRIVTEFYIEDIIDLFDEPIDQDLLIKKGFTASAIKTINSNLDKILNSNVTTGKLLRACCIPMVGQEFVQAAINNYPGGIDALLEVVPVDRVYDLLVHKPGIEMPPLTNFMLWLENNKERFVVFKEMFPNRRPDRRSDEFDELVSKVKALTNKKIETFCFTGSGPMPRNELVEHVYNLGHKATDNVNLCTVLVAEDPMGSSSKLRKARAKGIKIISYSEFMKVFNVQG